MNPADESPAGSRRRRLWQLPPAAHDLPLATLVDGAGGLVE